MIIRVNSLKFYGYHGVMPRERKVGQQFEVDLAMDIDGYDGTDNLDATVNYAEVIDAVRQEMEQPSDLIEHVCSRICRRIKAEFSRVTSGEVTVRKMRPPVSAELASVSVTMNI